MTETQKPSETQALADKPADPKQPAAELNEKELQQVSGGNLSKACATGKHFPNVTIVS